VRQEADRLKAFLRQHGQNFKASTVTAPNLSTKIKKTLAAPNNEKSMNFRSGRYEDVYSRNVHGDEGFRLTTKKLGLMG
jgi:hypothetical protein